MEKYRVTNSDGSFCEYTRIEEIPQGATHETIVIPEPTIAEIVSINLPLVQQIFQENRFKAECMVIDKQGDKDYIKAQRESYTIKKMVAEGLIVNIDVEANLQKEADDLGIDLPTLKSLVIQKYNDAETLYHTLIPLNESCRTRIQTHLENGDIAKYNACIAIYPEIICLDYLDKVNELMSV